MNIIYKKENFKSQSKDTRFESIWSNIEKIILYLIYIKINLSFLIRKIKLTIITNDKLF